MATSDRPGPDSDLDQEQTHGPAARGVQATPTDEPADVSTPRHLLGGLLAGIAAGCGMYAVLAAVAVAQGRDASYPLRAVHALLAGRRVLPDHPDSLYGAQVTDVFLAPLYFFLPAAAVGVFTGYRVGRHRAERRSWLAAAVPAAAATAMFFVVFVLIVALPEASRSLQRVSTGYGVRQLGVPAWVVAHLVYVALLVLLLGPLTRATGVGRDGTSSRARAADDPSS